MSTAHGDHCGPTVFIKGKLRKRYRAPLGARPVIRTMAAGSPSPVVESCTTPTLPFSGGHPARELNLLLQRFANLSRKAGRLSLAQREALGTRVKGTPAPAGAAH